MADGPARGETTALVYRAAPDAPGQHSHGVLILAHGAGAGQQHPFIVAFANAISRAGMDAVTFNFLYMENHRRIPDRAPALEACYASVVDAVRRTVPAAKRFLAIGGKSMGGRIATQLAASANPPDVDAVVLLGYPLHPPGRPDRRRDAHLPGVGRPMLFVQGSRDTFGTPAELAPVLSSIPHATLHVVEGGDHSFKLPQKDPAAQTRAYEHAQRVVVDWLGTISRTPSRKPRRLA